MNGNGNRGVKTNFFEENALFTLWFYLTNLCFPKVGECGNNQDIANKKEIEKTVIDRADQPGTGDVDKQSTGQIDKLDIGKADKLGTNGADTPGIGGANK